MKKNFLRWPILFLALGTFLIPARLLALDPSKSLSQYNCRNWTRQSTLPANGIRAMAQTRDGYLWLGTQKGLLRFDGNEFTVLEPPRSREWRNRNVTALSRGINGLWFGADVGGWGFYHEGQFVPLEAGSRVRPDMKVTVLRETDDGALWISTDAGIYRCIDGKTNETVFNDQIADCQCIYEDSRHRVWLGTTEKGLFYWEAGRFHQFPDPELTKRTIFAVTVDAKGQIWVGTPYGLRCYDSDFNRKDLFTLYTEVKALLSDESGSVWIGTSGDGLMRYRDGDLSWLRKTNGLAHDFVTGLLEDQERNLWVATPEGLSQLSDVKFPIFGGNEGLASGSCHGVCASARGGIWTATSRGICYFDGKTPTNYSEEAGLSSRYVKRVFEARNGDLYILNGSRDIEVFSNGKVVARYNTGSWPTAISEDAEGVVASFGEKLFRLSRSQMVPFSFPSGNSPDFYWIRNLSAGKDGSLLVASVNGVFRIKGETLQHWSNPEGLPDTDAVSVCEDDDHTIWVGLMSGVARIKNNRVSPVAHDQLNIAMMAIVPDNRGNLWLNTSRGIMRVTRRSMNAIADGKSPLLDSTIFDGLDSVKTIDTTDVEYVGCLATDGSIWFPTPQGAVKIDPNHILASPPPPPVDIQRVSVNGVEQTASTPGKVLPGKGELVFQYAGLNFAAPHKTRFRYRLDGYDSDWIEAGARRNAVYANLKPKHYTFLVQACNADGVWNTVSARYDVNIPPHVYETLWFRTGTGILAGLGFLGFYAWRTRHLRHKERKLQAANDLLESRISERTQELAEQRNLLRTLIDHLPDEIFVKDTKGRVIIDNLAHARSFGVEDPNDAIGKTDFDCLPPEKAEQFRHSEMVLLNTGKTYNGEEHITLKTGESRWLRTTKVALRDNQGEIIGLAGIHRDITDRKHAEAELESLHKQLLQTSRHAGMAEVATSVLHNVGNVLNSVNISTSVLEEQVRNSALDRVHKVILLLQEHKSDLGVFLTQDDKGKKLIGYLEALFKLLDKEKSKVREEVESLTKNVEHIKKIVSMQQSYARVVGLIELIKPVELVEDSLRMHEAAFHRHGISIIRDYREVPKISVDRHKVIQILVNLLQNAKYACDTNDAGNRTIRVCISAITADRIQVKVIDNGTGIPSENLTRIFSYGFTTRKNGHGFGLHSGALAAKEMGGSLFARSDGAGKGATFILELPVEHSPISAPAKNSTRVVLPSDEPDTVAI